LKTLVGEEMAEKNPKELECLPSKYGCDIIYERATKEQQIDKNITSDAKLVTYIVNNEKFVDVCRANRQVDIFDFYYDKYGPGAILKIDLAQGRIYPRNWGYKSPEKKRRK